MNTTARKICTRAMILIGAIGRGDTIEAEELNDAMATLNEMVESWSLDKLFVYAYERETFSLVANKATYTIGVGGDFDRERPSWLDLVSVLTNDGVEFEIRVVPIGRWQDIELKSTTAPYPSKVYFDRDYPLGNLLVWPKPDTSIHSLILHCPTQVSQFASLDTVYSLPSGYARALRYNLAIDLAPEWGKTAPAEVMQRAIESQAVVKVYNSIPVEVEVDTAITRASKGTYNIYADG